MARFEPFPALRYDTSKLDLADVLAPPYDVVDEAGHARLEARHPFNAVRVEIGRDGDGLDRYDGARACLDSWRDQGVLVSDDEPTFTVYRMGYVDASGARRQVTGVIGALGLDPEERGDVLPHEETMASPAEDRLRLLRACRANLSPIWGLSMTKGLTELCEPEGPPLARATDEHGVHHRVWRVGSRARIEAITEAVARAPVVLADGHHRYQTAIRYREEVRAGNGQRPGDHDLVMSFLVELDEDQLDVRPIHRLVSGLPESLDPLGLLARELALERFSGDASDLAGTLDERSGLGVLTAVGSFVARQLGDRATTHRATTDAEVARDALAGLPEQARLDFDADLDRVAAKVASGEADLALLLRPVSVERLRMVADAGLRLPQKTTFFTPKPATGIVFRALSAGG